jgi:outer membrane immunogenic protein
MRTRIGLILAMVMSTGFAGAPSCSAAAADLEPMPIKAAPTTPPAFNWSGVYFGVNGGGDWGHQDPFNVLTNRFDSVNIDYSGSQVGGTAGVNVQVSYLLVGLEADLDWARLRGSSILTPTVLGVPQAFTLNATTNVDWDLSVRVRIGYAHENWLYYTTAGVVVLGASTDLTTVTGANPCTTVTLIGATPGMLTCHGTDKRIGATVGGGIEYGFTQNWSAKVEYRYTMAASLEASQMSQVLAGINYRFGLMP